MRTIAILNLKGGTAKTVTSATMARCLAQYHDKRVLLIDADCQSNLTQYFAVDAEKSSCTTLQLLTGGSGYYPDIFETREPNISIIPATMDLAYADLPNSGSRADAIESLRENLEEDDAFDYCIIDLPPSLGIPTQAALLAADEGIIPIRLDAFSTAGMAELSRQVDNIRTINPRLRIAGILGTQFQRTDEEREIHDWLIAHSGLPVFKTLIRMSKPLCRSVSRSQSIFLVSSYCGAALDYREFVLEYLGRDGAGRE